MPPPLVPTGCPDSSPAGLVDPNGWVVRARGQEVERMQNEWRHRLVAHAVHRLASRLRPVDRGSRTKAAPTCRPRGRGRGQAKQCVYEMPVAGPLDQLSERQGDRRDASSDQDER